MDTPFFIFYSEILDKLLFLFVYDPQNFSRTFPLSCLNPGNVFHTSNKSFFRFSSFEKTMDELKGQNSKGGKHHGMDHK